MNALLNYSIPKWLLHNALKKKVSTSLQYLFSFITFISFLFTVIFPFSLCMQIYWALLNTSHLSVMFIFYFSNTLAVSMVDHTFRKANHEAIYFCDPKLHNQHNI